MATMPVDLSILEIDGVWFAAALDRQHVLATSFSHDKTKTLQKLAQSLPKSTQLHVTSGVCGLAGKVLAAMEQVYDGKSTAEDLALSLERLPEYTQRVLRAVNRIPAGYVASYGGVAEAVGGGARAVGNVMASNPFAPLIPCHRVVTSSLGLGGYGGGLRAKVELLMRERRGFAQPAEVVVDGGGVLRVFPVEFVLRKLEKQTLV
ncbi:MAG: methylated-DNA--[protein]-cysteine S-methyltransferase [Candidatus Bathyarchaeia archaeon]